MAEGKSWGAGANPVIVKALMEHLVRAFEQFADQQQQSERGLEYLDALMGCHNFYKRIILDLESRLSGEGIPAGLIRHVAVETLKEGLKGK